MSVHPGAVRADLARARNLYGPLDADARSRILAAIERPTAGTWRAARTLIVCAEPMLTLWQAVLAYTDHTDASPEAVPAARQIADGLAGATR